MKEIPISFEKEDHIRKVSYDRVPSSVRVILSAIILGLFSIYIGFTYGFTNLPIWIWIIIVLAFFGSLLHDKIFIEYNTDLKTLTIKKLDKINFMGMKSTSTYTEEMLKSPLVRRTINFPIFSKRLTKTITPEQSDQITNFLEISPKLNLPKFY